MSRTKTTRINSNADMKVRIDEFIERLRNTDQVGAKTANIVRNELRWLGAEATGDNQPRFALRTIKAYLTRYKTLIATDLGYHNTFEKQWNRLVKLYPELSDINLNGRAPKEAEKEIFKFKANLQDKSTGLYDALSSLKICHRAYYLMKLKAGQKATIKSDEKAKVIAAKKEKTAISKKVVQAAVKDHINNQGLYKQAVALMLCCGRRPVELFKTATFEVTGKNTVKFSGQAKGKATGSRDNYEIQTLHVSAAAFVASFSEFREKTKERGYHLLTNQQVNTRISADISNTARAILMSNDATLYTCRSIAANWVADLNPSMDRDIVMADYLGHDHDDIATVNSYQDVWLTNEPIKKVKEQYLQSIAVERKRVVPLGRPKPKAEQDQEPSKTTQTKSTARIARFKKMRDQAKELGRAVAGLHEWAIDFLESDPAIKFTQTMITKARPTSRPAIKKWLELVAGK